MEKLYPLELSCVLKTPVWSGTRLGSEWGKGDGSPIGESWELCVRRDECNTVKNGRFAGRSLAELIREYGRQITGADFGADDFPLLIKLIDAASDLSVQVHPDDEYSARVENDRGKTEMWCVLSADEGARMAIGLKDGVGKDELCSALENGRAEDVLNYVSVSEGDVYFIPAGLPHAIGKGILVAEIQQNCDLTYRIYDYGRLGTDGKPRELHVKKALDVIKSFEAEEIEAQRFSCADGMAEGLLAHCEYFRAELVSVKNERLMDTELRMLHLLVISGEGEIVCGGEKYPLKKGSSYLLPAAMGDFKLIGDLHAIVSSI
jgi:mannose-6-phosphate isomerase